MFNINDLAKVSEFLSRVIDCLDKGVSAWLSPSVYKRMEDAKLLIEQKKADQQSVISLKEAMEQDMISVARTSRDRQEIKNIASIYGNALAELQAFGTTPLPQETVKSDWAACFFDCAKDCCDEEVQQLWSRILAGEIMSPGRFHKRTLFNLRQMEHFEAEWFCELCRFVMDNAYLPVFVLEDERIPFNRYQSLVDCGFINADQGNMEIKKDTIFRLKSATISLKVSAEPFHLRVFTLTDMGSQICELVQTDTDAAYLVKLLEIMNKRHHADTQR